MNPILDRLLTAVVALLITALVVVVIGWAVFVASTLQEILNELRKKGGR